MSKANYFIGLSVILAMLAYTANAFFDPFVSFRWVELIFLGLGGAFYGFVVASFVAAVNAIFIVMVNRLFFDPEMSKSQYKARIVPLVGVLTLFLSMVVTLGIGAPFAAIAGAFGASKYADWYYEMDAEEKAKRSIDNLLEGAFADDDDDYYPYEEDEEDKFLVK
jgi:hypothetical protein